MDAIYAVQWTGEKNNEMASGLIIYGEKINDQIRGKSFEFHTVMKQDGRHLHTFTNGERTFPIDALSIKKFADYGNSIEQPLSRMDGTGQSDREAILNANNTLVKRWKKQTIDNVVEVMGWEVLNEDLDIESDNQFDSQYQKYELNGYLASECMENQEEFVNQIAQQFDFSDIRQVISPEDIKKTAIKVATKKMSIEKEREDSRVAAMDIGSSADYEKSKSRE